MWTVRGIVFSLPLSISLSVPHLYTESILVVPYWLALSSYLSSEMLASPEKMVGLDYCSFALLSEMLVSGLQRI